MRTFLVLLLLTTLFTQCKQTQEYLQPERKTLVEAVYASGKIKAVNQYQVFATLGGIVEEIYVQEGDTVAQNAPLFLLKSDNAALNIQNAGLSLEVLQEESQGNRGKLYELGLQVQNTKNRYEFDSNLLVKQQRLLAQGIGSALSVEQQELAAQQSYTQWKTAQSAYSFAQNQLKKELEKAKNQVQMYANTASDMLVRSATHGKLYFLNKKLGEMVLPQEPVALIGKADEYLIELQVDEQDISKIALGQKVLISLESYPNRAFEAQIKRIVPYMKEANKSFEVEAVFIQKPEVLYPNLSLEANIIIQEVENALSLPKKAILPGNRILLSTGDTAQITLGAQSMEWVQVLKGIEESDKIIQP